MTMSHLLNPRKVTTSDLEARSITNYIMKKSEDKKVTIYVNENDHVVDREKVSYADIVNLYTKDGGAVSNEYLVKYSRGHSDNISGTLTPNKEVMVKDGMRFRVSGTGES